MKKYLPIRIFSIKFGYGWWWGNYFFFVGKHSTAFAIMPMCFHYGYCTFANGKAINDGDTDSWSPQVQRDAEEDRKRRKKQITMKARIRKTGEVVDVIDWSGSTIRSHLDTVSYIDSQGVEHDRESLNYYWDFEPIDKDEKDAHWQEIRNQAAIAAMTGVMNFFWSIDYEKETIAKMAVEQADALIDELKLL